MPNDAKTSRRLGPKAAHFVQGAIALAVLAPMFWWLWPMLTTPNGSDIPADPPEEKLRVFHPFGFSIIAPKHWNARVRGYETDAHHSWIGMYPGGGFPRRYSANMAVRLMQHPPDNLSTLRATTFQDLPAYEEMTIAPSHGLETPALLDYTIYFERDGDWYSLHYGVFAEFKNLPVELTPYLTSFQTHRRPTEKKGAD